MASVSRQVRRMCRPERLMVMVLIGALLILITQADSVHTPAPSMREQAENGPERKRKPSNSPKKLPSKVDYDDTDELGLELVQGFVSMVGVMFGLAGDSVRTVSQTTAGAAGGSVKLVGGAVKGFGKAVESMGERTTGYGVPGGSVVGGMLGVMGHAARGLGDTVSVLGHVAEEITAETGKVFEDAVRSSNPLDAVSSFLDTSNAPSTVPIKSSQTTPSSSISSGTGSSSSGTRWGRWDDLGRPQSYSTKQTDANKATAWAAPSSPSSDIEEEDTEEHEPRSCSAKALRMLLLLLHGSVALLAAGTQGLLSAAAGLAAPTCRVPSLLPHLCAAGLFVRGVTALLDRSVEVKSKSSENTSRSSSCGNSCENSISNGDSGHSDDSCKSKDRTKNSFSSSETRNSTLEDKRDEREDINGREISADEGREGESGDAHQPLPHRSWWRRRGAIAGAVVYIAAVDQTARLRVASRAAVEAVGAPPDRDWGGGYHTGLEGRGRGGWSLGGQPESVEWLNRVFAAIWHQPLKPQSGNADATYAFDDHEAAEHSSSSDSSSSSIDGSSSSSQSSSYRRNRRRQNQAKTALPPPVVCHGCNGSMCTTAGGVGPYVAASVIHDVTEVLAESSAKPDSIASVAIQGFDLGEDPPRLRNIDVVDYGGGYSSSSSSSSGGQVRLRLKAGWAAEGFKFALSLKLSTLEHAMLPQLTLRVDRLVVGLVADVELVPKTTMPFLEAVRVSLAEVPTIDFRLQPLSGVDLVAVPGLRAWIQTAIQSALVDAVSPGYLEIRIAQLYGDPCADVTNGGGSNNYNSTCNNSDSTSSASSSVKVTPPLKALLEQSTSCLPKNSAHSSSQSARGKDLPSTDFASSDPATMAATAAATAAATSAGAHTPEAFKARMAQALATTPTSTSSTSDDVNANPDLSTGKLTATRGDEVSSRTASPSNSQSAGTQLASEILAWLRLAQKRREEDREEPSDSSFQTNALIAAAAAAAAAAKAHPENAASESWGTAYATNEEVLSSSENSEDSRDEGGEGSEESNGQGTAASAPMPSSKVWKRDPGAILLSALTAGAKEWWEHQKLLVKEASNDSNEARDEGSMRKSEEAKRSLGGDAATANI